MQAIVQEAYGVADDSASRNDIAGGALAAGANGIGKGT
jgi:hypothetical protein